ncbi:MAG: hypothetical protein IJS46_01825 [Kiritimatiellae bacterium]|nr:hypothetical protein [Kiritimatiellia bacterium]
MTRPAQTVCGTILYANYDAWREHHVLKLAGIRRFAAARGWRVATLAAAAPRKRALLDGFRR